MRNTVCTPHSLYGYLHNANNSFCVQTMFFIKIHLKLPQVLFFLLGDRRHFNMAGTDFDTSLPFSSAAAASCAIFWQVSSSYQNLQGVMPSLMVDHCLLRTHTCIAFVACKLHHSLCMLLFNVYRYKISPCFKVPFMKCALKVIRNVTSASMNVIGQ